MARTTVIDINALHGSIEHATSECTAAANDLRRNGIVKCMRLSSESTAAELRELADDCTVLAREAADCAVMLRSEARRRDAK